MIQQLQTEGAAKIGVIIVTHMSEGHVTHCLESIMGTGYPNLIVVVVDNCSSDETCERVKAWCSGELPFNAPDDCPVHRMRPVPKPLQFEDRDLRTTAPETPLQSQITLMRSPRNFGFAGGVNIGLRGLMQVAGLQFFWVINPDCVTFPETPFAFVAHAQSIGEFSIMGCRLVFYNRPHVIQADGGHYNARLGLTRLVNFERLVAHQKAPNVKDLNFIPGTNMFLSRLFLQTAGLMDESWFLYSEEVDWALRRGTLPLAFANGACVAHRNEHSSVTSARNGERSAEWAFLYYRNYLRMCGRWAPSFIPLAYFVCLLKISRSYWSKSLRGEQCKAALRSLHGIRPARKIRRSFSDPTWAILRSRRPDSSTTYFSRPISERRRQLSRRKKVARFITSLLDPRSYLHFLKVINFHNYSHSQPIRSMSYGDNCSFAPTAMFANSTRIFIGDHAIIGPGCYLWAGPEFGHIFIGNNLLLGPEVMITAASYRFRDGSPVQTQRMNESDITIGDDVWIGTRAVILPGSRIGDGAIIGAASVVRGDIPSRCIAAGAPARVVGKR